MGAWDTATWTYDTTWYPGSLKGASDPEALAAIFEAHEAEVKAFFPPGKLLVHQAKDGWEPLCAYLGVPVPAALYPSRNSTAELRTRMNLE